MKVLWFSNILFPELAKEIGKNASSSGGWMQQFKLAFSKNDAYNLTVAGFDIATSTMIEKHINGIDFYIIPKKERLAYIYDNTIEQYIDTILEKTKPDLVHIWGSEFPHSLAIVKMCNLKKVKFMISIQGLIFDCARHYTQGLSFLTVNRLTLRDFLRRDNIFMQKKKFEKRGNFEIECLKRTKNVIGRTIYDYATIKEINNDINYFFCNECLRSSFYEDDIWNINNIQRNTIFLSQAYYPIKGFHYFLEALAIVKKRGKNIKVIVAGDSNPFPKNVRDILKQGSYAKYLTKMIMKNSLKDNIQFLDNLNEHQMKEMMKRIHIFVSPSLIENSSNSVGEAMILGVPIISSFVGGISDMVEHNVNGLLYPVDQPSILAEYIINILENDTLAIRLSKNSRKKALDIYNIDKNIETMKKIYDQISKSNN